MNTSIMFRVRLTLLLVAALCYQVANGRWRRRGGLDVRVVVPSEVHAEGDAQLLCQYQLYDTPLYSVKWYRGSHEFYRFEPQETPPGKFFKFEHNYPGYQIYIDVNRTNDHQVTLINVAQQLSGNFTCEVTTEEPFTTACASGHLKVNPPMSQLQRRGKYIFPHSTIGPPDELNESTAFSSSLNKKNLIVCVIIVVISV